jgi:poly(A) polymerase
MLIYGELTFYVFFHTFIYLMQQKTYHVDEHQLPLDKIDPEALYILDKLRLAGYVAYLVGGSVRDLLLQKTPKDYDISTSAEPEEIKKIFRNCILIGRRFRLAHIRFGKKIFEVSTFRAGDNEADTLIVRDNVWGTPEEDVLRRDFTINGLFYDSSDQSIIDYVGGYPDIQRKYLRSIGQPYLRFKQDPVRMIRLLKFVARFGFEIDPEARIALLECRREIVKSSPARILEELLRMLESGASTLFMKLMAEHGVLQLLMESLTHFLESEDGQEVYSYLNEVDRTILETKEPLPRPVLLSCLLFPLFQKHIQFHFTEKNRIPHLGEIQNEANSLIDEIFRPFFLLPKRMRGAIISILSTQYRLTPLDKRRGRKIKIPSDPDFPLAMAFFDLRRSIEPGLQKIWEEWRSLMPDMELKESPSPKPRRRKRRRS